MSVVRGAARSAGRRSHGRAVSRCSDHWVHFHVSVRPFRRFAAPIRFAFGPKKKERATDQSAEPSPALQTLGPHQRTTHALCLIWHWHRQVWQEGCRMMQRSGTPEDTDSRGNTGSTPSTLCSTPSTNHPTHPRGFSLGLCFLAMVITAAEQ